MITRLLKLVPFLAMASMWFTPAFAQGATLGQSDHGQVGLQGAATPVMAEIHSMYDLVNLVIIAIALFVLVLMIYVMYRFRESANPTPSTTTHNTLLEVAWTVIPILILVAITIPSFKLLMMQYTYPKPDLTIKAIGNAWFWEHEYPAEKEGDKAFTITSNMITDEDVIKAKIGDEEFNKKYGALEGTAKTKALYAEAQPLWTEQRPRQLAVDNEIVVPVNKVVHVLITSNDVIHNWTIPSFGSKMDAVPGRVTTTWFKAEKEGAFFGQCSELCGVNHSFMPIGVRVVNEATYGEWIAAMRAGDKKKAKEITDKVALEHAGIKKVADAEGSGATK
jgi:cytochrome c oxidase subunit II